MDLRELRPVKKSQSQNFAYCMIALYNILKMTKTRDGGQITVTNG